MLRHLRRNPRQILRSWYALAFQVPWLPEAWLNLNHGWALARALRRTSRPGTFSREELDQYREAWSQPRAITSMVNWYRAAVRYSAREASSDPIGVPALLIWGARDRFLGREMAQPSLDFCEDGRLELIEDATHWVYHEEPERVNELIRQFVGKP